MHVLQDQMGVQIVAFKGNSRFEEIFDKILAYLPVFEIHERLEMKRDKKI